MTPRYDLVVAPPARRALENELPEAVAHAAIDLITGPLLENPQRLGEPLHGELSGLRSARRGTYRIVYRIIEARREVFVVRIAHRSDAYRPH